VSCKTGTHTVSHIEQGTQSMSAHLQVMWYFKAVL